MTSSVLVERVRMMYEMRMSDPLLRRLRRAARFLNEVGILENLQPTAGPRLAPLVARDGLNVRTIHAIHAAQHPQRIAMVDDRRVLTYAEADVEINRIARTLSKSGIAAGERVILCLENRVEYLLFWFAGFRAGISVVHASYRSTPDELTYLAAHSRARAIVCSQRTAEAVRGLLTTGSSIEVIVVDEIAVTPRQHAYPAWTAHADGTFFRRPERVDGHSVVYTSGTTGKPKGAVRNFASMGIVELSRIGDRLPMRVADRHLVVCPLYHSGAQALAAIMTSLGATIYLADHFEPRDTLSRISRWSIHNIFMVPTMIQRLVELDDEVFANNPTDALRSILSGAAPFPDALRRRAIERFGASRIYDFYGATEMGWITLIDGHEMLERAGSVGRALEGHELAVRDVDGHDLPCGEVGTIWVRTAQTMDGYLDDRAATNEAMKGGWITVDDLGYLDADGYIYLAGRDRDMVISGGVNIYPVEIEEALSHHPDVVEVAIVGAPDEQWGERLVCFVVGAASEDALEDYARQRLASFKVPRQWVYLDELPRNPTGKVLKRQLRESLA